ncbi:MAG: tetratricopeptide (TPR) repeat protein, partial [Limisphaerales bacterium]
MHSSFHRYILQGFLFTALVLGVFSKFGCSSSKQNIVERTYHDVAARDNAYFNATLKIKETEQRLFEGQIDNYEEVIPLFKYGIDGGKSSASDMDDVIKKCSFPIQLHEDSKWVDDAYFLIGKAHFYKQDFPKAIESFQYLIAEYSDILGGPSKGKKKKKKKKSSKKKAEEELPVLDQSFAFLKHAPRSHEASLWIARSLTQAGKYSDAQTALSVIRSDEGFPEALEGELEAVQAHLMLAQNKYKLAIEPLQRASELTKKKASRARFTFILAQLYARQNRAKDAIETYEIVLKLRPNYEMEFFARINMANIYRDNKLKSGTEVKKMLADLLKDEKNLEYFGLIYYAIADIELEAGREEEGIENLNLSVRNAGSDKKQQALSYLRIADINYDKEEFQTSFYYYDSCLASLDQKYIRYKEAKDRRDGLEGLVSHLKVIEVEERLQYWASLPEKAHIAEIEEWLIETQGEEEDEEDEYFDPLADRNTTKPDNNGGLTATGQWYFYDNAARGRGYSEFKKLWGKRADDDNWRRSDRRTFAITNEGEEEEEGISLNADGSIDLDAGNLKLDDILAILPIEEDAKLASDEKIMRSLYNLGNIYKEYLENDGKAISYFERLFNDYPTTNFRLKTIYNLYLLHTAVVPKEKYKKIILNEYSESVFAQVILDPEYFVKLEQKDLEVKNYYAATFDLYEEKEYSLVLTRIEDAETRFEDNPIKAHFALLDAMVYGEQDLPDDFKQKLQGVVNDFPDTDQARRAQELLNYLRRGSVIKDNEEAGNQSIYEFDGGVEHFVCLIINQTGREVTALKNDVVDFNKEFFSLDKLRVSSLLFEQDKTIVLVKTFSNQEDAMKYYRSFAS